MRWELTDVFDKRTTIFGQIQGCWSINFSKSNKEQVRAPNITLNYDAPGIKFYREGKLRLVNCDWPFAVWGRALGNQLDATMHLETASVSENWHFQTEKKNNNFWQFALHRLTMKTQALV